MAGRREGRSVVVVLRKRWFLGVLTRAKKLFI